MRNASSDSQPVILITGINGQVGFELLRALQGLGRVVGLDRAALDLLSGDQIRSVVRGVKPAIIINPAAYTMVDNAEADVDAAMLLNAEAPRILAEEAAQRGAVLIHYSTDYVFDGKQTTPYVENDAPNPQSVYGHSKLAGEQAIISSGCSHQILRTSWIYGLRGRNFLLTMLRLGAKQSELRVVADQTGAPTWAASVAAATAHIVAQGVAAKSPDWWRQKSGVYHMTCAGKTTWHGFAEAIFASTGRSAPIIMPIRSSEYPCAAKRPANSTLSNSKLLREFGLQLPQWDDALRLCLGGDVRA